MPWKKLSQNLVGINVFQQRLCTLTAFNGCFKGAIQVHMISLNGFGTEALRWVPAD